MSDSGPEPAAIGPFIVLRKLGEGAMGVVYAGFDVALDRKVALKLIRRQLLDNPEVRARMIREAQAMARLSHPNVVQVYQVGEHEEQIYLAMEYVEGQTLTAWLRAEERPWQLVLRTVVGAGRGLAAAHAAGLVHRDFKPDNVLVGADGRARVLDFGLVDAGGLAPPSDLADVTVSLTQSTLGYSRMSFGTAASTEGGRPITSGSLRLTQLGKLLGTPAYMAPEQHFGEAVGPLADQFSFSITLYEALYGFRPFGGMSWSELKQQVRRGHVPPPGRRSRVPSRVFRILTRGLAPTPAQRFPTLDAMLDALERDPRRATLRAAAMAGLVALAAGTSYAVAHAQLAAAGRCGGAAAAIAEVWGPARAAEVERTFVATGAPFAAEVWARVSGRIDAYAEAWTRGYTEACEAHAEGTQSATLLDLRMACLARRKGQLAALVEVFGEADREVVENAVQAAAGLPGLDACADTEALRTAVPPPDDPQVRARVEALRGLHARAEALERTGQFAAGIELAGQVRREAATLDYLPLDAEAALAEGKLLMAAGRAEAAEAALTYALRAASEPGLDAIAAEAAATLLFVRGESLGRPDDARATEPFVDLLVRRVRDGGRIAALMHNNLGVVYELADAAATAELHYQQTIRLLGEMQGPPDPLLAAAHYNLGELLLEQGEEAGARRAYERAVALFDELLGALHPWGAFPRCGLAELALRAGRFAEAEDQGGRALALLEAAHGPEHLFLIQPLVAVGRARLGVGRRTEAAQALRRAAALSERHGQPHSLVAIAHEALAELALSGGDPAEARAQLERAVEVHEALSGAGTTRAAPAAVQAAELAYAQGDAAGAIRLFEKLMSMKTGRKGHVETRARAALGLARALIAAGEAPTRPCALLREALGGLREGDERRVQAETQRAALCGPG